MNNPEQLTLPVAGIILAAGAASRMGQPKLLLPWKGQPLIRHALQTGLAAGLDPLIVVTGAHANLMQAALDGLPARVVHNPHWQQGQSTSVRAGMQALPPDTQAVLFLLGDQPFVTPELIRQLVSTYARTGPAILAPYVGQQRTNPVLFDQSVFMLLCQLQGDAGARTIFTQVPPEAMPWPDERLLFDVDTPADYEQLLGA